MCMPMLLIEIGHDFSIGEKVSIFIHQQVFLVLSIISSHTFEHAILYEITARERETRKKDDKEGLSKTSHY